MNRRKKGAVNTLALITDAVGTGRSVPFAVSTPS
jgi:hypothetical protein